MLFIIIYKSEMQDKDTQIFNSVVDAVTQQEFQKATFEFMTKNSGQFDDNEENKLEYTNIYTEYVHILDQMIDSKLKESYSDAELEAFYTGFKDRMPEYEKINKEVVDNLFAFLDFDVFKKTALKFKHTADENYAKDEYDTNDTDGDKIDQDENLFHKLMGEDTSDPNTQWRKSLE